MRAVFGFSECCEFWVRIQPRMRATFYIVLQFVSFLEAAVTRFIRAILLWVRLMFDDNAPRK
jgi:hypothetical protein